MKKHIFLVSALVLMTVLPGCNKKPEPDVPPLNPDDPVIIMTSEIPTFIQVYLRGTGTATIYWGDGKTETFKLSASFEGAYGIYHSYYSGATTIITGENITSLRCIDEKLTTFEVAGNNRLTYLSFGSSVLTNIDISKAAWLGELACNSQFMDVSKNLGLEVLRCEAGQLTSLDVSKNTILRVLRCDDNQLTSLDISNNIRLNELWCHNNPLTSLDVSKNTVLRVLYCFNNELTSQDVSKNSALRDLICSFNQLTILDVSNNTALTSLGCSFNHLTCLDMNNNIELEGLNCSNNQLTSLDVSKNNKLSELNCNNNQLTSLDVSKNNKLFELICNNNQLTSLDVSNCTTLYHLDCSGNQFTSEALNVLFESLPIGVTMYTKQIIIKNNPGTADCDRSIAERKGWSVIDYY